MKTLLVLAALILTGCGVLSDTQIKAAEKACEPHGGVDWHRAKFFNNVYAVRCKDLTDIDGRVQK